MLYSYSDYERQLDVDLAEFLKIIILKISSEGFDYLSPKEKFDCIWEIFESFSREHRVPEWARCNQKKVTTHDCKWKSVLNDIFNEESQEEVSVVFRKFVYAHKLPHFALCFERINNNFLHDLYFRCKRCDNYVGVRKVR